MKQQSGFVPVNFNLLGKILIVLGVIGSIERIINYFSEWNEMGVTFTYFSIISILVGLYMLKYNPKGNIDKK